MTEAAEVKVKIAHAAMRADEASLSLIASDAQVTDIGVQINNTIEAIEDAQTKITLAIRQIADSRMIAQQAVEGSNANVDYAVSLLREAETDQSNDLVRLTRLKETFTNATRDIIHSMRDSNGESHARTRRAAGELRGYAGTL